MLYKLEEFRGICTHFILYRYELRSDEDGECNPSDIRVCEVCRKWIKGIDKQQRKERVERSLIWAKNTNDISFHFEEPPRGIKRLRE